MVYKPKRQVSKIVQIVTNKDGQLVEVPYEEWNWDGKLLESISYHWMTNKDKKPLVEHFKYDGNRIISNVCENSEHTTEYIYDGKFISKIVTDVESPLFEVYTNTFEFEHDGKKSFVSYRQYTVS